MPTPIYTEYKSVNSLATLAKTLMKMAKSHDVAVKILNSELYYAMLYIFYTKSYFKTCKVPNIKLNDTFCPSPPNVMKSISIEY